MSTKISQVYQVLDCKESCVSSCPSSDRTSLFILFKQDITMITLWKVSEKKKILMVYMYRDYVFGNIWTLSKQRVALIYVTDVGIKSRSK